MTAPIPILRAYKVRDPVVVLERCDKIWETLKVIKDVQCNKPLEKANVVALETTSSGQPNPNSLYIRYEPILNNNNDALPNFTFSVKATKRLYHCSICGKQYTENRGLRHHSERTHGVHIPLKRHRNSILYKGSTDKEQEKQRESNVTEKEGDEDNHSKVGLKKDENKLCKNVSFQSAPSSDSNIADPNVNSQQKSSNMSIRTSDNVNVSVPVRKEQEKGVPTKELKENEKSTALQGSGSPVCILCKQLVKDMKKHLIDYHKIESPEFMLKNLNNTSTQSKNDETNMQEGSDKDVEENETAQRGYSTRSSTNGKRRSSMSDRDTEKKRKISNNNEESQVKESLSTRTQLCEICLGIYKWTSFHRHRRIHVARGETKENFHLSNFKYRKSPLHLKSKKNLNDVSSDKTNDCNHIDHNNSNSSNNKETDSYIAQNDDKDQSSNAQYNEDDTSDCSCGKSFRDPHTLFMHKKKCNTYNKVQPTTEGSEHESTQDNKQDSSDRDSGIGISITIKKKNNSYEIVDKCNAKENFGHVEHASALAETSNSDEQMNSQNEPLETLELSKYSENHSILKIESIDEDIDIDIEEDFQTNSCPNDIVSSTSAVTDDVSKEEKLLDIKVEQDDDTNEENINSDLLQKKVASKMKRNKHRITKANFAKKYNVCVCGRKFYTRKAFEVHMSKHHSSSKLICGYCKIVCPNVAAWNKHQCSINEGKRFIDMPIGINCFHCNASLSSYKQFDAHIKYKHFDSILPYQCFECFRRFHNFNMRKMHFEKEHGISACSICSNKCYHSMIARHKAYHYGLGFPCHLCKKTYSSKHNLVRHVSRVHPSKQGIKSDTNGSSFTFSTNRGFHEKTDMFKKSFRHNTNIEVES